MSDALIIILVMAGFIVGILLGAWLSGDFQKTYAADDIQGMKADLERKQARRLRNWSWMRTFGAY